MDAWIPVVVVFVTAAVAWIGVPVNRLLAQRDVRSQIKADHELYGLLGDEFDSKAALRASIDRQVRELVAGAGPLDAAGKTYLLQLKRQRLEGVGASVGGLGMVLTAAVLTDDALWVILLRLACTLLGMLTLYIGVGLIADSQRKMSDAALAS